MDVHVPPYLLVHGHVHVHVPYLYIHAPVSALTYYMYIDDIMTLYPVDAYMQTCTVQVCIVLCSVRTVSEMVGSL